MATEDILAKNMALTSPFPDSAESCGHLDGTTREVWRRFIFHLLFFLSCWSTTGFRWVELFPSVNWKTEPPSTWLWLVNGWNFNFLFKHEIRSSDTARCVCRPIGWWNICVLLTNNCKCSVFVCVGIHMRLESRLYAFHMDITMCENILDGPLGAAYNHTPSMHACAVHMRHLSMNVWMRLCGRGCTFHTASKSKTVWPHTLGPHVAPSASSEVEHSTIL